MAHAGWLATQGIVRAAGGTISTVFRTLIGTTLGAISTLTPIFQAQMTAGSYFTAAMGIASLVLAREALTQAEAGQQEYSDALRGANMAIHGVQSMLGVFDW